MTHQQALELGHTINQNNTKLMIWCNKDTVIYIVDTMKHSGYKSSSPDFNDDDLCLTKVDRTGGWVIQRRSIPEYIHFRDVDLAKTPEDRFLIEMEDTLEEYGDAVIKTYDSRN